MPQTVHLQQKEEKEQILKIKPHYFLSSKHVWHDFLCNLHTKFILSSEYFPFGTSFIPLNTWLD